MTTGERYDPPESVGHVGEIPVCRACGLAGDVSEYDWVCQQCRNTNTREYGAGPIRVVTPSMTYHETPLCPAVQTATEWVQWRDEECVYADIDGDMDKCIRCHSHRFSGFDEYAGDTERQIVIGHR